MINDTIKMLQALFEPGDVFEIRLLDAVLPGSSWQHTESGYFDYEHIDQIPNLLANFKTYGGVYVTLNPVNPDLLARANNRFKKAKSRESTGDKDILRRRWMLVDVDPVRPAGISATEGERDLSFDKATEIAAGLELMGFPRPTCVNSGNGTQLLYRIDLPADDGGLVQQCLQALLACSTEDVQVDLSVHNPSRICRLPGTWNRKGDSTDTRPHRIAEIIDKPAEMVAVSEDLLRTLANSCNRQVLLENPTAEQSSDVASCGDRGRQIEGSSNCPSRIDDYNNLADITSLLEKHGWRLKLESDQQYWWRPGKADGQHSATFNGEVFYVFSANAQPFEHGKGYSKFAVYSMLEHGGDNARALEALEAEGYGDLERGVDLTAFMENLREKAEQLQSIEQQDEQIQSEEPIKSLIVPLSQLFAEYTGLNKPIIHGLLREGETMNVIAGPKIGKSWFTLNMAISIASGKPWFNFNTEHGRVLHIDNELHKNTLTFRYSEVCAAMGVSNQVFEKNIDTITLRGKLMNIYELKAEFNQIHKGQYKVIILDAFYKTLPVGTDENDNAAMANIYNIIDCYADKLGCAFILIHHSSKGNQSSKSVTDVGAGAGSISRAVDTHLIIRPHEEDYTFVLDAAMRSWEPIKPVGLRWQWPLFWRADEVDTSILEGTLKKKTKKSDPNLEEFVDECIAINDPCSKRSIVYEAGRRYELSERKVLENIELAEDRELISRLQVGSRMKYVKNREGVSGEKSLIIAAFLENNPSQGVQDIAETVGVSDRQVRRIAAQIGKNLADIGRT